jgi:hypothetical protein
VGGLLRRSAESCRGAQQAAVFVAAVFVVVVDPTV